MIAAAFEAEVAHGGRTYRARWRCADGPLHAQLEVEGEDPGPGARACLAGALALLQALDPASHLGRPEGWECPWCGPAGLPVDLALEPALRLCAGCARSAAWTAEDDRLAAEERARLDADARRAEGRERFRPLLDRFLAEEWRQRWPCMEFGKAHVGNMLFGALAAYGCDPGEELQAALERLPPRLRHFDPRFDSADDYMRRAEAAVAERAARSAAPAKS